MPHKDSQDSEGAQPIISLSVTQFTGSDDFDDTLPGRRRIVFAGRAPTIHDDPYMAAVEAEKDPVEKLRMVRRSFLRLGGREQPWPAVWDEGPDDVKMNEARRKKADMEREEAGGDSQEKA